MMTSKTIVSVLLSFFLISVNLITLPADYLNFDRALIVTPYSFIYSLILFFFALIVISRVNIVPRQMFFVLICFIFIIIIPAIVGILQNSIIETMPNFLRFCTYVFSFFFFYFFSYANLYTIRNLDRTIKFISVVLLIFSIVQVARDEMIYMNGAYRLSSIYGLTPAGFALITLVFSVYFYSQIYVKKNGGNYSLVPLIFFMINTIMMAMTQSRQSLMTLILLIGMFHFLRSKKLYKIITLFIISFLMYGFYWLVVNTDLFPRLTQMLFNYASDSSTHTRITIITKSYEHLGLENIIYGIGLGGFNQFYYGVSGDLGVAAHNDFFLFFVEGGVLSLFFYCSLLIGGAFFWLNAIKRGGETYFTPFLIFCALYILSFLNNPFYYPQVQVIGAALMGIHVSRYITEFKSGTYVL